MRQWLVFRVRKLRGKEDVKDKRTRESEKERFFVSRTCFPSRGEGGSSISKVHKGILLRTSSLAKA